MDAGRAHHARAADDPRAADRHQRRAASSRRHAAARTRENFATREQNLTWTAELGADNRIIAGHWWTPADFGKPLVSLASEFQESLGLRLGDQLTFDIAGESVEATVASIRKVKWDSFQPNFFIVFAPGVLEGAAGTYMTSAYFSPGTARSLAQLAQRFPSVSIFDIDELLGAGARGARQGGARRAERVRVHAACRPHGAARGGAVEPRRAPLRERDAAHARVRAAASWRRGCWRSSPPWGRSPDCWPRPAPRWRPSISRREWLELRYAFELWPWAAGILGGALLVAAGGWLATRSVVRQPPLTTLRA